MLQLIRKHMLPHTPHASAISFYSYLAFFTVITLILQNYTGGFSADRSNHADEAAHFVSSLAISDYLTSGFPTNPFNFVINYYAHFPKVAIGHWPPAFEFFQALVFLIFGGTGFVAIVFQAAMAGLVCALTGYITSRSLGTVAGITAGFLVLLSPIFLPITDEVMADTLEALLVTLTTLSWSNFYIRRSWLSSLLFAFTASLCILTKGTGFGLVLMPFIYVAFRRDLTFLFHPRLLVAGAIIGMFILPWYIFTYHMAADGFVYTWGWNYSRLAVPFFFFGLFTSVGLPCALMYFYGVFRSFTQSDMAGTQVQQDTGAFAASSLAMIIFSMLAPADLDTRYLIPALPGIVIVAFYGSYDILVRFLPESSKKNLIYFIPIFIFLAFSIFLLKIPDAKSLHSEQLVQEIISSDMPNTLVLVSGSVEAEGAFISSFAENDTRKRYYVIRAQKALAHASWMGDQYELKFHTPEEVTEWIKNVGIGWIVIDEDSRYGIFPHTTLLKKAIDQGLLAAQTRKIIPHIGGEMMLYSLPQASTMSKVGDELSPVLYPGHIGAKK